MEEPDMAKAAISAENTNTQALLTWLDEQRADLLGIFDDLPEEALRRPVLPSGWSWLSMVRHLIGMDQFGFRAIVAGKRAVIEGAPIEGLPTERDPWQV